MRMREYRFAGRSAEVGSLKVSKEMEAHRVFFKAQLHHIATSGCSGIKWRMCSILDETWLMNFGAEGMNFESHGVQ